MFFVRWKQNLTWIGIRIPIRKLIKDPGTNLQIMSNPAGSGSTTMICHLVTDLCVTGTLCRGRGEECVVLARSLVCLATWTLSTATHTILRLVELRDSKVGGRSVCVKDTVGKVASHVPVPYQARQAFVTLSVYVSVIIGR